MQLKILFGDILEEIVHDQWPYNYLEFFLTTDKHTKVFIKITNESNLRLATKVYCL